MHRLSSWLDALPLPRRPANRRCSRKGSRSAAPAIRFTKVKENEDKFRPALPHTQPPPPPRHASTRIESCGCTMATTVHYTDPWERTMSSHQQQTPMISTSLSQASGRKVIRTNPWISRTSLRASSSSGVSSILPSSTSSSSSTVPLSPPYSASSSHNSGFHHDSRLHIKSFEESTCSSGYGSQDSSPESSVHSPSWQALNGVSPSSSGRLLHDKAVECRSIDLDQECGLLEETSSFSAYEGLDEYEERRMTFEEEEEEREEEEEMAREEDEAKNMDEDDFQDEHVYHELESLARISRVLEESNEEFGREQSAFVPYKSRASPVYARPYAIKKAESTLTSARWFSAASSPIPLGDVSPAVYSQPQRPRQLPLAPPVIHVGGMRGYYSDLPKPAPTFRAPPPPPLEHSHSYEASCEVVVSRRERDLRKIERDFLAELDAQIAELQLKSEHVRSLVDEARLRRATPNVDWRRARWHNTFELCL